MSFSIPPIPSYEQCLAEADAGRVSARVSADGNYVVFNYTPETSLGSLWNDVNMWCRGLVFRTDWTVAPVAVPFFKFFNINQRPETSTSALVSYGDPVRIADKVDGSLGIVFFDELTGLLRVTTRGSLESDQAVWASRWINDRSNYGSSQEFGDFLRSVRYGTRTHQFEIVYPQNRIIVDYGDFRGLVYLSSVSSVDGMPVYDDSHVPSSWRRAASAGHLSFADINRLSTQLTWQTEGWVITYSNGLMVKLKVADYKRVHGLRFSITPNSTLKCVKSGIDPLLAVDGIPDEFIGEIRDTVSKIEARYGQLLDEFHAVTTEGRSQIGAVSRKESALWCLSSVPKKFQSAFFHVLSGRGEPREILLDMVTLDDIAASDVTLEK